MTDIEAVHARWLEQNGWDYKQAFEVIAAEVDRLTVQHNEVINILWRAREALRFTREYVGEEVLPPIPGWSWYDSTVEIDEYLRRVTNDN